MRGKVLMAEACVRSVAHLRISTDSTARWAPRPTIIEVKAAIEGKTAIKSDCATAIKYVGKSKSRATGLQAV